MSEEHQEMQNREPDLVRRKRQEDEDDTAKARRDVRRAAEIADFIRKCKKR